MNYQLIPKELRPIAEKVEAQQRISEGDALTLYGTNDLNALGMIANLVRERKNGNYATYIHNRYINYSNICILSCQFCAFAARKFCAQPALLHAPQAVPKPSSRSCATTSAAARKPPPLGLASFARGIRWAAAARAPRITDTAKRLLPGLIICPIGSNYMMKP